jgi:hypothetical protein
MQIPAGQNAVVDPGSVSSGDPNVNHDNGRVDVAALDREGFQVESDPAKAGAAVSATFDLLRSEMGDIEEMKVDGVYKDLTADHVRDMDPVSRRILHNARVAVKQAEAAAAAKVAAAEKSTADRAAGLAAAESDLTRRMRDFAAVSKSPEIQKLLASSDAELPPVHTKEGIEARIKKGIAEGMQAFLKPMQEVAAQEDAKVRYQEFLEKNPDLKDPTIKSAVHSLVRSRIESGNPISTEDALELVRARNATEKQRQLAAATRASRSESNAYITTRATNGAPGSEMIPKEVTKRGAVAINQWLDSNPAAKARYQREAMGR